VGPVLISHYEVKGSGTILAIVNVASSKAKQRRGVFRESQLTLTNSHDPNDFSLSQKYLCFNATLVVFLSCMLCFWLFFDISDFEQFLTIVHAVTKWRRRC